jgi:hypothetical protein
MRVVTVLLWLISERCYGGPISYFALRTVVSVRLEFKQRPFVVKNIVFVFHKQQREPCYCTRTGTCSNSTTTLTYILRTFLRGGYLLAWIIGMRGRAQVLMNVKRGFYCGSPPEGGGATWSSTGSRGRLLEMGYFRFKLGLLGGTRQGPEQEPGPLLVYSAGTGTVQAHAEMQKSQLS